PLENVWKILKQRIKACGVFPGTIESMTKAIEEEWDKLIPKDWNNYIDSMFYRLQQVKDWKGMQTEF
ncbi:transposable element Tcb1 transposase, partial [Choiromyces venosus 120613-1]